MALSAPASLATAASYVNEYVHPAVSSGLMYGGPNDLPVYAYRAKLNAGSPTFPYVSVARILGKHPMLLNEFPSVDGPHGSSGWSGLYPTPSYTVSNPQIPSARHTLDATSARARTRTTPRASARWRHFARVLRASRRRIVVTDAMMRRARSFSTTWLSFTRPWSLRRRARRSLNAAANQRP